MVPTLIAGLSGLLGVVLGRAWDYRSESGRWRRDQRIRTYEKLAATYYRTRDQLRLLAVAAVGTETKAAANDRVLRTGAEWQRDVVAVWLHGSASATAAVKALDDLMDDLYEKAQSRQYSTRQWEAERRAAEDGLEAFITAVRAELALPRLPVSLRSPSALLESQALRSQE